MKSIRTSRPLAIALLLAMMPLAPKLGDGDSVHYLDIGRTFLGADGKIDADLMPDLLHPNAKGYATWAEAIEPAVAALMGETQGKR